MLSNAVMVMQKGMLNGAAICKMGMWGLWQMNEIGVWNIGGMTLTG
jgi:hypothetical protein